MGVVSDFFRQREVCRAKNQMNAVFLYSIMVGIRATFYRYQTYHAAKKDYPY